MNTSLSVLVASVSLIGLVARAAEPSTNLVSIYLVDRPNAQPWPKLDTAHLKDLNLVAPPILADSDFVAFDSTNHSFVVTGEAAKRLARRIWELGKKDAPGWGDAPTILRGGYYELIPAPAPFVIEAFGERIYAGAFYTRFSSSGFEGPVIMAKEMFIKTNLPKKATFSFSIGLGYPGTSPGTPDPRGDKRIVSAVRTLFGNKH
jgi:hypothetical protein